MPKAETASRPSLATSSSAFALPPPSSSSAPADPGNDSGFVHRLRRASVLAPKAIQTGNSPLASSFTMNPSASPRRRSYHRSSISSEHGPELERMRQENSPTSSSDPSMLFPFESGEEDTFKRPVRSMTPSTPPQRSSPSPHGDPLHPRRPSASLPLKQPRLMSLLSESRPDENEVKSEAAFQRLVTSSSIPMQTPRTPRSTVDRGRYPEEGITEDSQPDENLSDDEDLDAPVPFKVPSTESLPGTRSAPQSVGGDDPPSLLGTDSSGSTPMDVDMPYGSPSVPSTMTQWRYTPPPTTSAVRSHKRKLEDRFDPYPSAAKRRAGSPSLPHLRGEGHNTSSSTGRPHRISIPIPNPSSGMSSTTSSPTVSSSYPSNLSRSAVNNLSSSSPTMRSSMALGSPVMRPIPRPRTQNEEREVDGAGDAVTGLTIT